MSSDRLPYSTWFSATDQAKGLQLRHELTATDQKSPAQVARDIRSKILPGYMQAYENDMALLAERKATQERKSESLARVGAAVPTTAYTSLVLDSDSQPSEVHISRRRSDATGKFRAHTWRTDGISYDVQLDNIPEVLAARVALVLADYLEGLDSGQLAG